MARSTYKITLLLLWVALVREVLTQDQTLPDTAAPELQAMMLSRYNEESENDAETMGRNAAEDMGALMASPPIRIFRVPQPPKETDNQNSNSEYTGASGRAADSNPWSPCYRYDDASSGYGGSAPSGRSAAARTIPLAPLPPMPVTPGLSPLPLLAPLIQSLTNPGRLGLGFGARPLLRTPMPYIPPLQTPLPYVPPLQTPMPYMPALRSALPTYQLPRVSSFWIPPRARSSFTPSANARSANQYKPLIFYV